MAETKKSSTGIIITECILEQDARINEVVEALQYQVAYENSMIIIQALGTTPPATGNYTLNHFVLYHTGSDNLINTDLYLNGLVAPNTFLKGGNVETMRILKINSEGMLISNYAGQSYMGGSGTVYKLLEIPLNPLTYEVDLTKFGD